MWPPSGVWHCVLCVAAVCAGPAPIRTPEPILRYWGVLRAHCQSLESMKLTMLGLFTETSSYKLELEKSAGELACQHTTVGECLCEAGGVGGMWGSVGIHVTAVPEGIPRTLKAGPCLFVSKTAPAQCFAPCGLSGENTLFFSGRPRLRSVLQAWPHV